MYTSFDHNSENNFENNYGNKPVKFEYMVLKVPLLYATYQSMYNSIDIIIYVNHIKTHDSESQVSRKAKKKQAVHDE